MTNNTDRIRAIVQDVRFPGYTFEVRPEDVTGLIFIRVTYNEPDVMTGVLEEQQGRWWLVYPEWEPIQIVQTCLKAVLTSLEHRCREHFLYRERAVFQPH